MATAPPVRLCLRQSSATSRRLFSTSRSQCKNGTLTEFPPTSSQELDTILSTLRKNVFFPAHLAKVHKQLVYRPTLQHYLTGDEPVKVTLRTSIPSLPSSTEKAPQNLPSPPKKAGDFSPPTPNKNKESMILEPLNRFTDEPRTGPTVTKIIDLMTTPNDFALLPDLFRELQNSNRKPTQSMLQKAVRKAASAGHIGVVLELFRRVESTGARLNEPEIAREMIRGTLLRAAKGEWSEEVLNKSVQNAQSALRMMEEPRHWAFKEKSQDARQLPDVAGAMLALVAARSLKVSEGLDSAESVEASAQETLKMRQNEVKEWAQKTLKLRQNADFTVDKSNLWDASHKLMRWTPVLVGAQLAKKVLAEAPEAKELTSLVSDADKAVKTAHQAVLSFTKEGQERRALAIYDDLTALLAE